MPLPAILSTSPKSRLCTAALIAAASLASVTSSQAQAINVPNFSFEQGVAPLVFPFVNNDVVNWTKGPKPAYYDAAIGDPFGIPFEGTSGTFYSANYLNAVGNQSAYLLSYPQVSLFQTLPDTFAAGKSYQLTLGLFGKGMDPGSTFTLSLYYLNGATQVAIPSASTTATFNTTTFVPPASQVAPSFLIDYSVNLGVVQPGDAWAGKPIGIKMETNTTTTPTPGSPGPRGNWDFDNMRLNAVPEPASAGLVALGAGLLSMSRRRARRA